MSQSMDTAAEVEKRYVQLNQAAAAAKGRGYASAIELLYQAKSLKGDLYDDTRLAILLQRDGRFDEAIAEIKWLIEKSTVQAQLAAARQSASVQQLTRVEQLLKVHAAALLICERERRPELITHFEQQQEKLQALHDKLKLAVGSDAHPGQGICPQSLPPANESPATEQGLACPKCAAPRPRSEDPLASCPQCGIIYARYDPEKAAALQARQAAIRSGAKVEPVSQLKGADSADDAAPSWHKYVKEFVVKFSSAVIFLIVIVFSLAQLDFSGRPSDDCNASYAYAMTNVFVEERLKAPSTAKFPPVPTSNLDLGNGQFAVTSYVDAQNGFGAMVRQRYSATVQCEGKNWKLIKLVM